MRLRGERKAHNEHAKLQNIFRINKSGRREFRRAPEFKFFYRSGSRYSGISRHDSTVKLGTGSSLNRACLALESCEREDRTQKLRNVYGRICLQSAIVAGCLSVQVPAGILLRKRRRESSRNAVARLWPPLTRHHVLTPSWKTWTLIISRLNISRWRLMRKRLLRTDETLRNSWRRYIFTTVIMSCTKKEAALCLCAASVYLRVRDGG